MQFLVGDTCRSTIAFAILGDDMGEEYIPGAAGHDFRRRTIGRAVHRIPLRAGDKQRRAEKRSELSLASVYTSLTQDGHLGNAIRRKLASQNSTPEPPLVAAIVSKRQQ